MPNPNAIVSTVIRLIPPLDRAPAEMLRSEGGLSVELEDGRRVRLDPANPLSPGFAKILDGLSKQPLAVYLEIEPTTSAITRLLIPHIARVYGVRPITADSLDVELERSHARHTLRRDLADFADVEKLLNEAMQSGDPLIITEDDSHNIIDVRPFKPRPDFPKPPPLPRPEIPLPAHWLWQLLLRIWRWRIWPWNWWPCLFRGISAARAQQVFNAMSATSCNPLSALSPCIPFLYPDDGCWGRASEMCRLMINMGLSPKKVWIQGTLHVSTKNNPNCSVSWGWHVAPILCVRGPGFFQAQEMVIDPSLFTTPVTEATWKGVQGDPNATLTETSASIFWLWGNITDPGYIETDKVLAKYRLKLEVRSLQVGPPPYANC